MAKELPYFQFEPAEYLTKDISFCSLSAQGLFINICSFYWQRGCKLTKTQVLRRFNHPDVLKELDAEGVIKYDNEDNIIIMFLLRQFESIVVKKSNDSEKGKIGNLKRWHRETYNRFIKNEISLDEALSIANSSGGDTLAITKISQIREDKIREDKYNDKSFLESWSNARKHYLKKPTHIKKLDFNETNYFKDLIKDYTPEEIKTGIYGLFKQKNKNISSMYLKPKHFLENFVKYYNAELSKDYELYGSGEKAKEQL